MTPQEAKDAIRRSRPMLKVIQDLADALEVAADAEKVTKEALTKKAAAEQAYQQAHADHLHALDGLKNAQDAHAALVIDLDARYQAKVKTLNEQFIALETQLAARTKAVTDQAAVREANALTAVKNAEATLAILQTRIVEAEKHLTALKGA